MFLLFGRQGALRHALPYWSEFSEVAGIAFNAAATAKPASAEHSQPVQERAACPQCAAYAVLAAALSMLVILRLTHTRH